LSGLKFSPLPSEGFFLGSFQAKSWNLPQASLSLEIDFIHYDLFLHKSLPFTGTIN